MGPVRDSQRGASAIGVWGMNAPDSGPVPRIAVVGAGAVGGYYGAKLAAAGCDVHFLMRSDLEWVRTRGMEIRSPDGDLRLPPTRAHASTAGIGPCDAVLIALKATANDALPSLLPPLIGPRTMLVTMQNGLGNEEFLATRFGEERVLGCLCFVCLNRVAPGVIEHYGHGSLALGEFGRAAQPRTRALTAWFERAGIPCEVSDDLGYARWRKLVWNIPFNGLAIAAGGATVGDVLSDGGLEREARGLMRETIAAARGLGFDLPEGEEERQIEKSRPMGAYRPSSLIDWKAGRPVEVDAIWSEPLRRAVGAGVDTPRLALLEALLRRVCGPISSTDRGSR